MERWIKEWQSNRTKETKTQGWASYKEHCGVFWQAANKSIGCIVSRNYCRARHQQHAYRCLAGSNLQPRDLHACAAYHRLFTSLTDALITLMESAMTTTCRKFKSSGYRIIPIFKISKLKIQTPKYNFQVTMIRFTNCSSGIVQI